MTRRGSFPPIHGPAVSTLAPVRVVHGRIVRADTPARRGSLPAPGEIPADVLIGIQRTDAIYITSPEQHQAPCAPLIVGLLEQIRHTVYKSARTDDGAESNMLWLLDEVANIAPIHDLPALVSQAGGQHLQVVIGLQDLSQARTRWGQDAADGFLSLFQAKLILTGISEPRTLEAISIALDEYDREMTSLALGRSEPQEWLSEPTHSDTVSYQTQRQRVLTPATSHACRTDADCCCEARIGNCWDSRSGMSANRGGGWAREVTATVHKPPPPHPPQRGRGRPQWRS